MNNSTLVKTDQTEHKPASPLFLVIFSFLVALILGMIVFVTTIQIYRTTGVLREPLFATADVMMQLGFTLDFYKHHFDTYPPSLQEMQENLGEYMKENPDMIKYHTIDTYNYDGWGNKLSYTSDGTSWKLLSFGADGQPDGVGINADVWCTDRRYYWRRSVIGQKCFQNAFPTFAQTLGVEWRGICHWVLFTIATAWPIVTVYCFLSRRKRRWGHVKEAFQGLGCVTLIVAVMWFMAVVLYYCMPGD